MTNGAGMMVGSIYINKIEVVPVEGARSEENEKAI
jgi:hypothetical protein